MIVEVSEHNREFSIGDLVNIEDSRIVDGLNNRRNGIITEMLDAKQLVYYAVYWPNGETQIIFSGALTYANANDKESNRNWRPRRIDGARLG